MNDLQKNIVNIMQHDKWEVFMEQNKDKNVIMHKIISGIMFFVSIKPDGMLYFNRGKL